MFFLQFHAWPYPALYPGTPSPGYEIVGYDVNVSKNQYSEGDTYSKYEATYKIKRETVGSILKFIAPIFLMSGLAMAALVFPSDEFMTKIELNAIFLLGILFFVQVVSVEIPTTGAMTVFDHVVMLNYIFIVITIGIPAVKWFRTIHVGNRKDDLKKIVNENKRETDLSNYALNSINLQIITLSLKLQELQDPNDPNRKAIISKREKLEGDRDRILGEMEENYGKRHDIHSKTQVDGKYKKEKMSLKWAISDLFRSPKKERVLALTEMNSKKIKEKEIELEKESEDLLKYYHSCNKVAWVLIGSTALIYGYFIWNIVQS